MKTSKQILKEHLDKTIVKGMPPNVEKRVIDAMKEFAEQYIQAAADECGADSKGLPVTPWAIQERIKKLKGKAKYEEKWKPLP
jgi:hypothetical protein